MNGKKMLNLKYAFSLLHPQFGTRVDVDCINVWTVNLDWGSILFVNLWFAEDGSPRNTRVQEGGYQTDWPGSILVAGLIQTCCESVHISPHVRLERTEQIGYLMYAFPKIVIAYLYTCSFQFWIVFQFEDPSYPLRFHFAAGYHNLFYKGINYLSGVIEETCMWFVTQSNLSIK